MKKFKRDFAKACDPWAKDKNLMGDNECLHQI